MRKVVLQEFVSLLLAQALMQADAIDEYRLVLAPSSSAADAHFSARTQTCS